MQVALWLAIAVGMVSARLGNRTAWALLASVALCLTLDWAGAVFHLLFWMLIDFAVILFVVRPKMTVSDCLIVALFVPAWALYLLPDPVRHEGSRIIVIAQFLLTFPLRRFWRRAQNVDRTFDPWDHFDLRVRHGAYA